MKKAKFNGEKLLLILGGVGIVVIIAVITFLITFSIGGKDVEKEESKATTSQKLLSDGAQSGAENVDDKSDISGDDVTEGIAEVPDVEIDLSCRDAVKVFTDCFIYGKTDDADKLLPMSAWADLAESSNMETQEFINVIKAGLAGNGVISNLDEGDTITCDVNNVLIIRDAAEEEIKNAISQKHNIEKTSITDVYAVSMVMEYNVGGEKTSEIDELFCVRIDGTWYLAEKDCLAVYYMLNK